MREPDLLGGLHRSPPKSAEAEMGVICSLMLSPQTVGQLCDERSITEAHFHLPQNAEIFEAVRYLQGERIIVGDREDFIAVTEQLTQMKRLAKAGGAAYVTQVATFLPTAAQAAYFLDILEKQAFHREMVRIGTMLAGRGYDANGGLPEAKEWAQGQMLKLCATARKKPRHNPGAIAREIFEKWMANDTQTLFGIPTGIQSLDAKIGGIAPGDLVVISGPTSSGKTAFALKIEASFLRRKMRVLDVTFEMTAAQKVKRLMQSIAGHNLRATMVPQREFGDVTEKAFEKAVSEISAMPLEIYDDRGATIQQVCAYARNLHAEKPLGLVCLDYDELVKSERRRGEGKEEEIAAISAAMKTLAGELGCPCLLLSQQTTDSKGNTKLRWSSAKQNDANILLSISTADDGKLATVSIMKNRDGARGAELEFKFHGPTTTFSEI